MTPFSKQKGKFRLDLHEPSTSTCVFKSLGEREIEKGWATTHSVDNPQSRKQNSCTQ